MLSIRRVVVGLAVVTVLLVPAWGESGESKPKAFKAVEIARGESWVSPYWGYSSPKIAFDGRCYYSAGLWGLQPDSAEGVVYKYAGSSWTAGKRLPGIYQPVTLALDSKGRLVLAYTRQGKPVCLLRAATPGDIDHFDELPSPPDMTSAYYIGIALHKDILYLAYLTAPEYTMYFARCNLNTLEWTPSVELCRGQTATKPKTAWTYPILYPGKKGLHFIASNAPDGGEGNTYNEVWYLFFPWGHVEPALRERVAESQMGTLAYAMDATEDASGRPHIVYMWNRRVYGDPLPADAEPEGAYHAWREQGTGAWKHDRVSECTLVGLFPEGRTVGAIAAVAGKHTQFQWQSAEKGWKTLGDISVAGDVQPGSSFLDVMSLASGSRLGKGHIAVVTDRLLPSEQGKPQTRVLWSLLPAE